MTAEEKEIIRWALQWKRNWDVTDGLSDTDYGKSVHVTRCDIGFYSVISKYETSSIKTILGR